MPNAATNPESEVSAARRLQVPLLGRREAGGEYVRLVLGGPPDWVSRPGQFINVRCESDAQAATAAERHPLDYREGREWPLATGLELGRRRWPLVRRPLSVSRLHREPDRVRIEVLVRTVGTGTRWLAGRPVGATLDVVLADWLADLGRDAVLIVGATTVDQVPLALEERPEATGGRAAPCRLVGESEIPAETILATDDGSAGFAGTAVAAAGRYLEQAADGRAVALYGCGPEPMLRALADLARRRGVTCQVSLEEFMGCGIGVCLSCVRKMRDPASEAGWTYRLTCRDGPVVEATDIIWE